MAVGVAVGVAVGLAVAVAVAVEVADGVAVGVAVGLAVGVGDAFDVIVMVPKPPIVFVPCLPVRKILPRESIRIFVSMFPAELCAGAEYRPAILSVGPNAGTRFAVIVWFRNVALMEFAPIVPVIVWWSLVCSVNLPSFPAPPPANPLCFPVTSKK